MAAAMYKYVHTTPTTFCIHSRKAETDDKVHKYEHKIQSWRDHITRVSDELTQYPIMKKI
jgi:surfactin synthase thioesterase subunit